MIGFDGRCTQLEKIPQPRPGETQQTLTAAKDRFSRQRGPRSRGGSSARNSPSRRRRDRRRRSLGVLDAALALHAVDGGRGEAVAREDARRGRSVGRRARLGGGRGEAAGAAPAPTTNVRAAAAASGPKRGACKLSQLADTYDVTWVKPRELMSDSPLPE